MATEKQANYKRLTVFLCEDNRCHTITLNGVLMTERLTPKMARRALRVSCGSDSGGTVWDHEYRIGYRVYANSARKLRMEEKR